MAKTSTTRSFSYFGQQGAGGGLNIADNPIVVSNGQMVVADNILIGQTFARKARGGRAYFYVGAGAPTPPAGYPVAGSPIMAAKEFWRYSAGSPVSDLAIRQDAKFITINSRTSIGVDRTGALVLSPDGTPCFQVFEGKLYFTSTNTSDGYNKWDGVAGTAVAGTAPADGPGKYLQTYAGKMIMAGNINFPFRFYWSETFDADSWLTADGGGSQDLEYDGDPEGITAIFPAFQGSMFIATRTAIYQINPSAVTANTFDVKKVVSGIGCVGHASVVAIPNDILFCSERGVHSLRKVLTTDNTEITFLSRDIQPLWISMLNPTVYSQYRAVWDKTTNCVIYSVPSSGQTNNDTILTFNTIFNTWTTWPNMNARSLCTYLVNGQLNVLSGQEDGTLALINQADHLDFGLQYNARYRTGVIYPGNDLRTSKHFTDMTVHCAATNNAQITVSWNVDGMNQSTKVIDLVNSGDTLGGTFVLGRSTLGVGQPLPQTITLDQWGYGIQIEVLINSGDVEIYGFSLEVESDGNPTYK